MANTYVIIDTKEEIDHIKMKIKQVMNFFKTKPLIKNSTHMFFENGKKIIFLEQVNDKGDGEIQKLSYSVSQRFKHYREKENTMVYGWFYYYINYNNYGTISEYYNYLSSDYQIEDMISDLIDFKAKKIKDRFKIDNIVEFFFENQREQKMKKSFIKQSKKIVKSYQNDLICLKQKCKEIRGEV